MCSSDLSEKGNPAALSVIGKYFELKDDFWRGIGVIEQSGLRLKGQYQKYDAGSSFDEYQEQMPKGCRCSDVILGRITPPECPLFAKVCTPLDAVGPCMVSTEGVCGIWYKNRGRE